MCLLEQEKNFLFRKINLFINNNHVLRACPRLLDRASVGNLKTCLCGVFQMLAAGWRERVMEKTREEQDGQEGLRLAYQVQTGSRGSEPQFQKEEQERDWP